MQKREVTAERIGNPAVFDISPTDAPFSIPDTELYVPVVTILIEDDNKLLQRLKIGLKKTIKWNNI